jgi:hypothetical protein
MKRSAIALTVALACTIPALAHDDPANTKTSGTIQLARKKLPVRIEALDLTTRKMTVKAGDGTEESFTVDSAVKNLGELKVGDTIVIGYTESVAWELRKPGTARAGVTEGTSVATAEKGDMPAAHVAKRITAVATVTYIDMAEPSIRIKLPEKKEQKILVHDREKLKLAKVGDQIEIEYTEALVITAEKAN